MEHDISRSEQKRQSKTLEDLATELVALPLSDLKRIPSDELIKEDILSAAKMAGGAKKRQIKYIAKCLRQIDCESLFSFLDEKKGSKLKQNKIFHELEQLRDDIISEAFAALRETEARHDRLDSRWISESINRAAYHVPGIDQDAIKNAAIQFVRSRKPSFSREIFRLLKSAREQRRYCDDSASPSQPTLK